MTEKTKKRTRIDDESDEEEFTRNTSELAKLNEDLKKCVAHLRTGIGSVASDVRKAQGVIALFTEKVGEVGKVDDPDKQQLGKDRQEAIIDHFQYHTANHGFQRCMISGCSVPTDVIQNARMCYCGRKICQVCVAYLRKSSHNRLQCSHCDDFLLATDLDPVVSGPHKKARKLNKQ